jgi:hypothetical protein
VEWPGSKPAGWQTRLMAAEEGVGGSLEGLSAVEGISGGGRTLASQSRGHRRGPSGWGGSTQCCDAWGGVKAVGEEPERVVRGGSATPSMVVFGAAQER